MDKGFKVYIFFLLWLGIVVGVPSLIFDARQVGIIGSIAASIGMAAMVLAEQGKENTFKKDVSVTYGHFWIFLAYAVGGMFTIGFGEMDYEEIKTLGKSIVFYAALPVPVLFIEAFAKDRIEKKKRMKQRIQTLHQVASSCQTLKMYFEGKVEKIEIRYKETYRSFAGVQTKDYTLIKDKSDKANFYIECPNPECTSGYIDLRGEVISAIREWKDTVSGEKKCSGRTAPDHPNQCCDVKVEYEISILYA